WGIAEAMQRQGAEIALSYPNEKMKPRVEKLAAACGAEIILPCDVSTDDEIENMFTELGKHWDGLDCVIHSIAFAPKEALEGSYVDSVTRESFLIAHEISSYSFAAMAKFAQPLMAGRNGSLLTLSYIGSVQCMPSYNVMGVAKASLEANVRYLAQSLGDKGTRVNAISAGPIRTLAAAGIKDFKKLLKQFEVIAPLGRVVTTEEVGNAAAFLCSDLASGITGEITYVDGGFNITGMSDRMLSNVE
ncbi:MAG: enoyl-ACP reductase, partial [Arenicellales bacterium]